MRSNGGCGGYEGEKSDGCDVDYSGKADDQLADHPTEQVLGAGDVHVVPQDIRRLRRLRHGHSSGLLRV